MLITAIETSKISKESSIFDVLNCFVGINKLTENTIIAIASKIISICEGNVIKRGTINKVELIKRESEAQFLPPKNQQEFFLTLKNNLLIPNAGIDESNCCDCCYALLPNNPQKTAENIWKHLRKRDNLKRLGVLITDSNVTPMRRGVVGIGIGWCGFKPLYDYSGQKDVYGKTLRVTCINLIDSLATAATLSMGEGSECTPIALLQEIPRITFQQRCPNKAEKKIIFIDKDQDLFHSLHDYAKK